MENLIFSEEQLDLFENTLPPETDEKGCDSFEDLVYVTPKEPCQILIPNLTEEQEEFLYKNLTFDSYFQGIENGHEDFLYYNFLHKEWLYDTRTDVAVVSFNDIFIHKDELE